MEPASEISLAVSPAWAKARALLQPLLERLAIDRAVVFGVGAKLWQAIATLITISVIAVYLTPQAQGYYYTFLNLMALQVFAELGLGYVVTIITKTATNTVNREPISVSNLPHGISFSRIPLSTTELCWKNNIHGAIVVPVLAIKKKNSTLVNPPGK